MTSSTLPLRPGLRLASQVCSTEIIVVRPGARPLSLQCGGVPMRERGVAADSGADSGAEPDPARMRGSAMGKRYTHPDDPAVELLVTVGGAGTLSADGRDLVLKEAKPLPASD